MPRLGSHALIYVGPSRLDATLPVIAAGADWTPTGDYQDVTAQVAGLRCRGGEHESVLTVTLADRALASATWTRDRLVIVRARQWDDTALAWGSYQVVFAGHVSEASGAVSGSRHGPRRSGSVVCRQWWDVIERSRAPAKTFGRRNLASGRPATASSVLATPSAENGVEYAVASLVGADQAVDGNRDTVWISNTVADPGQPSLINHAGAVRLVRVYSGLNGVKALELRGDTIGHDEGFESSLGIWTASGPAGTQLTRSSLTAATGSWSARVSGAALGPAAVGAGGSATAAGMPAGVECEVSFALRSLSGTMQVQALLGGGPGEGGADVAALTLTERWQRFTLRRTTGNAGQLTIRFKLVSGTGYYLDDVRIVAGVRLEQSDNKGFYLWFDSGLGQTGCTRLSDLLDLDSLGGGRSLILCYDAEAFRARFDPGPQATVVQWRNLGARATQNPNGLTGLDVASGRGRILLALYRRFNAPGDPGNLAGTGGVVWDDVSLAGLPAFGLDEALRRTGTPTNAWVLEKNPAFGGAAVAGTAWHRTDLGGYPATTLVGALGTALTGTLTVTDTSTYPAAGYAWLDSERLFLIRTSATTFSYSRSAPVAHADGTQVFPDDNGVPALVPLVSVVGLRRRAGTVPVRHAAIIGSILNAPRDPADAGNNPQGGVWGGHPDWFPLATLRENTQQDVTFLISRDGSFTPTTDPPPAGRPPNGRQVRWLQVVIDAMGGWQERAKLNEVIVYGADLGSDAPGLYAGTQPSDVRGIVGHLLTQHAGIPTTHLAIDRGDPALSLPWGAGYGDLTIASGSVASAISDLEARGALRVLVTPTGQVRVLPDPLTTAAAWAAPEQTWTADRATTLSVRQTPTRPVAQVIVTARHPESQQVWRVAYPTTPRREGRIEEIGDVLLGSQQQVIDFAIRRFRQANADWSATLTTGHVAPLSVWSRHVITITEIDRDGLLLDGANGLVTDYEWALTGGPHGARWQTTVELASLAPWA